MRAAPEDADEQVEQAHRIVNRAMHAHRLARQDPYGGSLPAAMALVIRVGYGTGDELADGRFRDALEVPPAPGPRNRADALRPQERLAGSLGRRDDAEACETLLLRARADLDGERVREAALQLRVGLEALLAEVRAPDSVSAPGAGLAVAAEQADRQVEDLETLQGRRSVTGEAANEALAGELSEARAAEVAETLAICERVLRRKRLLTP
jgi:hypothetical protein